MRRGEDAVVAFLSLFVAFLLMNTLATYYFDLPLLPIAITGKAIDAGSLDLFVLGGDKNIVIHYPLNDTYNFGIGDTYLLQLNVSADFLTDDWSYSLYDVRHDVAVETNTDFTPNDTFVAVRWQNNLTVKAHETGGSWYSESVFFYVEVPNSNPILGAIDNPIYFCENSRASYTFNATDADEDSLSYNSIFIVGETAPIYMFHGKYNNSVNLFSLLSNELDSEYVGTHNASIEISDGEDADSTITNITVIELNDAPFAPLIRTKTVYSRGENSTFDYSWAVTDEEDGLASAGNMRFNISWSKDEDLFGINPTNGTMNFVAAGQNPATYAVTVCVNDSALASPHSNITSECSSDGGSNTHCDNFSFVITDDNRAPEITWFSPTTTNFSVEGTTTTNFIVNVSDADMTNAYPDVDWYIDDVLVRHVENESTDTFSHAFGCGVSGSRNVMTVTTDDLENASQEWDVTVLLVACPISTSGGSSGGGGGSAFGGLCNEQWVCNNFEVCQNVERSFEVNAISAGYRSDANEICAQKGLDDSLCGFQITTCFDLANCSNMIPNIQKPTESRVCHFTENPSCSDRITNCHGGSCELLIDCGGPCGPCPTCSDGIQNQGELNIDCGGSCPFVCEVEVPYSSLSYSIIALSIFSLIILVFIFIKLFKIIRHSFSSKRNSKGKV